MTHIRKEHNESYYETTNGRNFRWQLPMNGDQKDCGIIKNQRDFYMFEMLYEHKTGQMYFIMENIIKKSDDASGKFYKFCLLKNNTICSTIRRLLKAKDRFNLNVPLQNRKDAIVLSENAVSKVLNAYRHLTWTIVVNDTI